MAKKNQGLLDWDSIDDYEVKTGGGGNIIYAGNLEDGTHIRILPPLENFGRFYFVKRTRYRFGDFNVTCPSFVGRPPIVDNLVKEVKDSGDQEAIAVLNNWKEFKKSEEHLMNVLVFEFVDFDGDSYDVEDYAYLDDEVKIFACDKNTLMSAIQQEVRHRNFKAAKSPLKGFDPELGFNLTIQKTGKKLGTKYGCTTWREPFAIEPEFLDQRVDLMEFVTKHIKSDEWIENRFNHWLYGEPLLEFDEDKSEDEKPKAKRRGRKAAAKKSTPSKSSRSSSAKSSRRSVVDAAKKPRGRRKSSLMDQLGDFEEEE